MESPPHTARNSVVFHGCAINKAGEKEESLIKRVSVLLIRNVSVLLIRSVSVLLIVTVSKIVLSFVQEVREVLIDNEHTIKIIPDRLNTNFMQSVFTKIDFFLQYPNFDTSKLKVDSM
jgi:hypothetical protein